jgi:hypothetical protein
MKREKSWTLVSLALTFAIPSAADTEERCQELGESCVCSEPMDNRDSGYRDAYDPSDSVEKECEILWAGAGGTSVIPKAMPATSTVDRVQAFDGSGIRYALGRADAQKGSTRRVCYRIYSRFSHARVDGANRGFSMTAPFPTSCAEGNPGYGDFDGDGNPDCCARNKLMRFTAGGFGLQVGGHPDGLSTTWIVKDRVQKQCYLDRARPCSDETDCPKGPCLDLYHLVVKSGPSRFTLEDCGITWCRFEACFSGDLLGGGAGGALYAELKVTPLARPEDELHAVSPRRYPSFNAGGIHQVMVSDMFRQQYYSPGEPPAGVEVECNGSRFLSHNMMAQWDTDEGQWIGCAEEIEGEDCRALSP